MSNVRCSNNFSEEWNHRFSRFWSPVIFFLHHSAGRMVLALWNIPYCNLFVGASFCSSYIFVFVILLLQVGITLQTSFLIHFHSPILDMFQHARANYDGES